MGMRGQSWAELLPSSSFVFKGMKVSAKSVPGRLIYGNGAHTNGLSYHNIHRSLRTKHSHERQNLPAEDFTCGTLRHFTLLIAVIKT